MLAAILLRLVLAGIPASGAPYEEFILAPSSRTVYPTSIHRVDGIVTNSQSLVSSKNGSAILTGNSCITLDYGKNIGGVVSLSIGSVSSPAILGLTFAESNLWINRAASDANSDAGLDSPLWLPVDGLGTYSVAREFDRGAFRYLSIVSNSSAAVEVQLVSVEFTASPTQELRSYTGYFNSDDELLNRIWYAGAYTCQLCSIDPRYGDAFIWYDVNNSTGVVPWYNNYTIAGGNSALVDGARRDRLVWPGDIVVAAPSIFVSTNDLDTIRNGLDSLLLLQNASGALPYAGSPFQEITQLYSFTYHLHSLLDIGLYYQYTGDLAYLRSVWKNFTLGLEFSLSHVDETGLLNVTTDADWLRVGMGGHNIEANAILYHTLNQGLSLATILDDTLSSKNWGAAAAKVKLAANALLWDETSSLFLDNETTTLHPQDGNAWAVLANLTLSNSQNTAITSGLRSRWGPYGAPAPEVGSTPATVSPFIGYFELLAHYTAGNASAALELMRTQWGFMLDDPRMTNSTFIEGYAADGSLRYAPYKHDARVSHAHGWSTGPTSLLTFYTAGLRVTGAGGETWIVAPRLGGLRSVKAGYAAPSGGFSVEVEGGTTSGVVGALKFVTPEATVGEVDIPGVQGSLRSEQGDVVTLVDGRAEGVMGGSWVLVTT